MFRICTPLSFSERERENKEMPSLEINYTFFFLLFCRHNIKVVFFLLYDDF